MRVRVMLAGLVFTATALSEIHNCSCDAAKAEALEERQCSIDRSLRNEPLTQAIVFLKDVNPTKPNRMLAIPRANVVRLSELSAADRKRYWESAIAKARELWGDQWGIAMNGEMARTQCHLHMHIGKLASDSEPDGGISADSVDGIPLPPGDTGLWVHEVAGKLHVHAGQQINETVLIR